MEDSNMKQSVIKSINVIDIDNGLFVKPNCLDGMIMSKIGLLPEQKKCLNAKIFFEPRCYVNFIFLKK